MNAIDWTPTYFERHRVRIASSLNALGIDIWNREVALDYLALGAAGASGGEVVPKEVALKAKAGHESEPSTPSLSSSPRAPAQEFLEEGDTVRMLEIHLAKYTDLVDVTLLSSLVVHKKIPGIGGGLIVKTTKGNRLKVAQSHVVKL